MGFIEEEGTEMKCELCREADAMEDRTSCEDCAWVMQYFTVKRPGATANEDFVIELFGLLKETRERILGECDEKPSMRMTAAIFHEHMTLLDRVKLGR
jgi:hypothetical protein